MEVAAWIRDRLWRTTAWAGELATLRKALAAEPRTAKIVERQWELACACEYIDPDRGRVLATYLDAWRGGHPFARAAVVSLAHELRAHVTLAEVANAAYAETKDPEDLIAAGRAYLDAGLVELAADPLQRAQKQHAADVRVLLAIAQHGKLDVDKELADAIGAAAVDACGDAAKYLQAVRIARASGVEATLAGTIALAARRCPDDDDVLAVVEDRLLERGTADDILHHFRARFDAAKGLGTWVGLVRGAAMKLVVRESHRGLGLRLLRMALEHAYRAALPQIGCHVAAWELLATHARATKTSVELVPLIVSALDTPRGPDDAMYLSLLGLEIAWKDAGDTLAAQPFAATVADAAQDNPLAAAFIAEVMPEMAVRMKVRFSAPPAEAKAPAPAPAPRPTERIALPKLEKPTTTTGAIPKVQTPTAEALARGTTRMPALKGAALATALAPEQGAVAAVRIPTQAIRALRRDTNRIPRETASPVNAQPRAPRRVMPVDVMIKLPDGAFFPTVLRDLSTSGAFVVTTRAIAQGAVVTLDLRLPTRDPFVQAPPHRTTARIARLTESGWGLAFIDPTPELVAAIDSAIAR